VKRNYRTQGIGEAEVRSIHFFRPRLYGYMRLGDNDHAFTWLEKAYEERARLPMLKK
jgi:hypothetical protein